MARPPPRHGAAHLVDVSDPAPQFRLPVVEVCAGEKLLVYLAVPLGPGQDGLSAGDGQLHVSDHPLLLLQQLPVLDLRTQGRGAGQGAETRLPRRAPSPPPTPPHGTSREPTRGARRGTENLEASSTGQGGFKVHVENEPAQTSTQETQKRAETGGGGRCEDSAQGWLL